MPRGEFDRSERKAATRARLLDAAAGVYARRGFGGATLDDVADAAGLTKGAVYGHFGSKEKLLAALMEEYLAEEISGQIALFDRDEVSWKRPVAGSDSWMAELDSSPDAFRLLVEFWLSAGRDEAMRERFAAGLGALRAMFVGFAADSMADAGLEPSSEAQARFADVTLALSFGLGMMRLADPENVPADLLGAALSVLVAASERDLELRAVFRGEA